MILKRTDDDEKKLLGDILVERDLINIDQLKKALKQQKKDKSYLGEILVNLGFVEEKDIIVALVVQRNLPYIAIDRYDIDLSIINILQKEIVEKYSVVPLDRVGNILSIVMHNPFDTAAKADIQRITKSEIATFIATKEEIAKAIARWY